MELSSHFISKSPDVRPDIVGAPQQTVCLDERHIADLRKSGLNDQTILAAGLRSDRDQSITEILGWRPKAHSWDAGLVFPFRNADGADSGYARVKLDHPRPASDGKPIKYESPRKLQNRAYFAPQFAEMFAQSQVVLVTEGEKKTLAAWQASFCCIGLVGVWGFQNKRLRDDRGRAFGLRQLISDLAGLAWREKTVVIVFDSDVAGRPDLQLAEYRLAELLIAKGATVRVVRLPQVGKGKTGLDDFLVHHHAAGPTELQKLIDTAEEPHMPKVSGPMDIAKILVDEAFTSVTGLRMRYWREDFWVFKKRCYELVTESELTARILRWLDKRGFDARPRNAADILKCLCALSVVSFDREMPCWLDGEDHGDAWVSFANGLFRIGDPTNIQSMKHTARYFSPWALGYAFNTKADCPTWLTFLADALDGDPERIDLLQRWFGLLLTSDTSFQKLLLLIGPPRAGKGTVVRIIGAMMGRANCASPTMTSLATRFGLSTLLTKSVAVMPDAHIGKHVDAIRVAEVLKSVVGEDPQDIDRKYRDPLTSVRLPTRFVVSCNELAHFTDPSGALAARLSVIPFFNSYLGREDRSLERRLHAELSGIVNWAIVGLARLRAEGRLNIPSRSQSIHDNFKRLSSPVAAFVDDCLELHPTFSETTADVYAAYVGWCKTHGHAPGSDARLGERLRSVNAAIERTRPRLEDGTRPYRYDGIRLTPGGREFTTIGRQCMSKSKPTEDES